MEQIQPEAVLGVLCRLAETGVGTRRDHEIAMIGGPALEQILAEWRVLKEEAEKRSAVPMVPEVVSKSSKGRGKRSNGKRSA